MESAIVEIEYREHLRQMAWINEHDWQFEGPLRQNPIRQAVAKGLLTLADVLAPTAQREPRTA